MVGEGEGKFNVNNLPKLNFGIFILEIKSVNLLGVEKIGIIKRTITNDKNKERIIFPYFL